MIENYDRALAQECVLLTANKEAKNFKIMVATTQPCRLLVVHGTLAPHNNINLRPSDVEEHGDALWATNL